MSRIDLQLATCGKTNNFSLFSLVVFILPIDFLRINFLKINVSIHRHFYSENPDSHQVIQEDSINLLKLIQVVLGELFFVWTLKLLIDWFQYQPMSSTQIYHRLQKDLTNEDFFWWSHNLFLQDYWTNHYLIHFLITLC